MSETKRSTNLSVENMPVSPTNQKIVNQTTPRTNVPKNSQKNDLQAQYQSPRTDGNSQSPTRFGEGTRIAKRELWWKEPPPSKVKIQKAQVYRPQNVGPKVDNRNVTYQVPQSQRAIEKVKLEWKAQPVVDTWGNFKHQPKGGSKRYPSENLVWPAQPKVDSGFIYYFEE